MIKYAIQLLMILMIFQTIAKIKHNKLKYKLENYLISMIIYVIIVMLLF